MRKINRPVSSICPGIFKVDVDGELHSKAAIIFGNSLLIS